jgi:GGDEF domain-containing protein
MALHVRWRDSRVPEVSVVRGQEAKSSPGTGRPEMPVRIFDRVDVTSLERREWHLWMLAVSVIFILALGLMLLMYPTVFSSPVVISGVTLRKTFFSFCVLAVLLVVYLVDRQMVISHLRRRVIEEQKQVIQIRHEASTDLLGTLAGLDHFRDRLAMEFRRASHTQQPLSVLLVELKSSRELSETSEVTTAYGDAAKVLTRKLRGEDSIYLFAPGVFGIVLPGVNATNAYRVVDRLAEGLQDASGASGRFSFNIRVLNYPEHAATAREIEEVVRLVLPSPGCGAPSSENEAAASRVA